jgi:hypothetical protein
MLENKGLFIFGALVLVPGVEVARIEKCKSKPI